MFFDLIFSDLFLCAVASDLMCSSIGSFAARKLLVGGECKIFYSPCVEIEVDSRSLDCAYCSKSYLMIGQRPARHIRKSKSLFFSWLIVV